MHGIHCCDRFHCWAGSLLVLVNCWGGLIVVSSSLLGPLPLLGRGHWLFHCWDEFIVGALSLLGWSIFALGLLFGSVTF